MKYLHKLSLALIILVASFCITACGGGGGGESGGGNFSAPDQLGVPTDTKVQATFGGATHVWRCRADGTARWSKWVGDDATTLSGSYEYLYVIGSGSKQAQLELRFMDNSGVLHKYILSLEFTSSDTATASVREYISNLSTYPYYKNTHYTNVPVYLFWE